MKKGVLREYTRVKYNLSFYNLFWIFITASFFGVIVEMFYAFIFITHKLESRMGLLYGPFNPLYGIGAIILTLLLYKIKKALNLFIFGAVIGALYEYIASVFQEIAFGTRSWYYLKSDFGILNGRTSLLYAVFWGFLSLVWMRFILPQLFKLIENIPIKSGKITVYIVSIVLIIDICLSALAVVRMTQRNNNIYTKSCIADFFDNYYGNEVLYRVYPNMSIE